MTIESVSEIIIRDERTPWLNVHSAYDEMPLTIEAFRVLCHFARRANNQTGEAKTTYKSIGEKCFRASFPSTSSNGLRRRAMRAVTELEGFGLVRKAPWYSDCGDLRGNVFTLTHSSDWNLGYDPHDDDTTIRKGGSDMDGTSDTDDTPYQGCDEVVPTVEGSSTNGGTEYKGIPHSESKEGNPSFRESEKEIEASSEEPTLDSTLNTPPCPAVKSKSLPVQSKGKKKTRSAKEIYAAMENFDDFMTFWNWYKSEVASLPGVSHDGGNRAEAGEAWLKLEANNFFDLGKTTFWQAIALQLEKIKSKKSSKGEVIGVVHASRFLTGGEKGEPNWLVTYEESKQTTTTDISMIVANVETSSLESIRQQILAILSELNMTAALPPQVQEKTGCKILSELNQEYAVKYLNYLKRHKEKKEQEAA
jgi:hypothetical protein